VYAAVVIDTIEPIASWSNLIAYPVTFLHKQSTGYPTQVMVQAANDADADRLRTALLSTLIQM
jgi:hypothetical protein